MTTGDEPCRNSSREAFSELLEAKKTLSARLLRARVESASVATAAAFRVSAAVSAAGSSVHAVGIGRKVVNGDATDTRAVRLYVVQKLPQSLLPAGDVLPASIDGIPTDVIEAPPAFLLAAPAAAIGDALLQPGPADGGTAADRFADLHRFVPINLGGTSPNQVDAAIGALRPGIAYRRRLCRIGAIAGTAVATEDMRVRKHGRTSGYTEGIVTDESYDALIGMDHSDPSVLALFENQLRIERVAPYPAFGLGGDSGSLIVMKAERRAVGLYFAGPQSGVYGVANHIEEVLNQLEIALL